MRQPFSRRELLQRTGMGFGSLALGALMSGRGELSAATTGSAATGPFTPRQPHFAPKAKRVIHLFMNGGPSQVDTFDPKPSLAIVKPPALPEDNYSFGYTPR